MELNKKREAEIQNLKRELEAQAIQSEQQLSSMKKKQQDAVNDLSDQVDQLSKVKSKWVQLSHDTTWITRMKQLKLKGDCDTMSLREINLLKDFILVERFTLNCCIYSNSNLGIVYCYFKTISLYFSSIGKEQF